jgi:hemerythrin-like metal-binding protein
VLESRKPSRITAYPLIPAGQPERKTNYWDLTVEPILNQKNEVEGLILAETEVTRRVRTEQAFYKSSKILTAIERALELHNPQAETGETLGTLLAEVIDLTESEYGFIGEVLNNADGRPYLKIGTILNFTQDNESPSLPVTQEPVHLNLSNPDSLPGRVIYGDEAVIDNHPANEPGSSGIPEGHPVLNAFLGLPLGTNEKLTGMIGLANCVDGYDSTLVEFLQPLLKCYLRLIDSSVTYREKHEALTSLEDSESLIRELAVPTVENEHNALTELINECYEEMDKATDTAEIRQLVDKSYFAISEHFLSEESLMQSISYPGYDAHKNSHDRFRAAFRSGIDHLFECSDHDVHALQKMLVNWFGRHWSTFDLDLSKYYSH